jgi:hypothetical protein
VRIFIGIQRREPLEFLLNLALLDVSRIYVFGAVCLIHWINEDSPLRVTPIP